MYMNRPLLVSIRPQRIRTTTLNDKVDEISSHLLPQVFVQLRHIIKVAALDCWRIFKATGIVTTSSIASSPLIFLRASHSCLKRTKNGSDDH